MNTTQEEILRKITGEERLDQAFAFSDFLRDLTVINIKQMLGVKATRKKTNYQTTTSYFDCLYLLTFQGACGRL